ncbi:hypothetical protein ADUPG1_008631, partial [Aduncisulcus paluster]
MDYRETARALRFLRARRIEEPRKMSEEIDRILEKESEIAASYEKSFLDIESRFLLELSSLKSQLAELSTEDATGAEIIRLTSVVEEREAKKKELKETYSQMAKKESKCSKDLKRILVDIKDIQAKIKEADRVFSDTVKSIKEGKAKKVEMAKEEGKKSRDKFLESVDQIKSDIVRKTSELQKEKLKLSQSK